MLSGLPSLISTGGTPSTALELEGLPQTSLELEELPQTALGLKGLPHNWRDSLYFKLHLD